MALDPSIPLQGLNKLQGPINLLGMANQAQSLGNTAQLMRARQQQIQQTAATQAGSQDIQASLAAHPNDYGAAQAALARDPRASYAAAQLNAQLLAQKQAEIQAQQQKFDLVTKQVNWVGNNASALLQKPTITDKDVIGTIADGVKDGVFPSAMGVKLISQVAGKNNAQLRQILTGELTQAQGVAATLPHFMTTDTGQMKVISQTNPNTPGGVNMVAALSADQASPAEQNAPRQVIVNGQPSTVPASATPGFNPGLPFVMKVPGGNPLAPANAPVAAPGAGGALAPPPSGTPAPVAAPAPGLPAPAGSPAPQSALVRDAVQSSYTPQQEKQLATSGDLASQLQAEQPAIPEQRANLQQGLAAINSGATTGPGAPTLEKYGALAAELTGRPWNQATQTQLLDKSSSWLLQNSLKGLGVPTDGKMAAVAMGNPNSKMTPDALRAAIAFKMGGLDYKQSENAAWQDYQQANGASANFSTFTSQWNKQFPTTNVFSLPYLSEPEQIRVLKAMTAKQRADFVGSLNSAMAKGWVQLPSVFAQKGQ